MKEGEVSQPTTPHRKPSSIARYHRRWVKEVDGEVVLLLPLLGIVLPPHHSGHLVDKPCY